MNSILIIVIITSNLIKRFNNIFDCHYFAYPLSAGWERKCDGNCLCQWFNIKMGLLQSSLSILKDKRDVWYKRLEIGQDFKYKIWNIDCTAEQLWPSFTISYLFDNESVIMKEWPTEWKDSTILLFECFEFDLWQRIMFVLCNKTIELLPNMLTPPHSIRFYCIENVQILNHST